MVWKLSSLNSDDSGSYVFVSPGTYKIGRKDCAVCIPTDKTISRLHAELVIQEPAPDPVSSKSHANASLRDLSKFGTFVNKQSPSSSKPVMSLPNKQTSLYDGDEITFGTMSSTFRASYLHFFFCVSASRGDSVAKQTRSGLGAYSVLTWNSECTHLLVEDNSPVNDLVLKAISHRKPIVSLHWLEAATASGSSPAGNLPSFSSFTPTLKLPSDGSLVKVTDPETRHSTFKNVVFLATSLQQYFCKENLRSLVAAAGGALELASTFKDSKLHQIIIVPDGASEADVRREFRGFHHIQRIKESGLLAAVISGSKDRSAFFAATSESQSTGATVDLQDTEDEADSVDRPESDSKLVSGTQTVIPSCGTANAPLGENKNSRGTANALLGENKSSRGNAPLGENNSSRGESKASASADEVQREKSSYSCKQKVEAGGDEYGEVSFVVGLVVREEQNSSRAATPQGPNFKRFQRVGAVAGNSFQTFVPFAALPYGETSYFNEVKDRMEEEKQRSEAERVADELFKRDDLKRKRTLKGESLAILKESSSSKRKK